MKGIDPELTQVRDRNSIRIVVSFITLFLLLSAFFVLLGQINADEAWYVYASRLVYRGLIPYRDFAFTQMPLLPYIYGLPQRLFPQGLYLGRITSVLLSSAGFLIALLIARKYRGWRAAAVTSVLWATFSFGIYYQSITKTYALTTLLLLLAFFFLTFDIHRDVGLGFAAISVLLAALTRLSGLLFALPVLTYAFIASRNRIRLLISVSCVVAASWILLLSLGNPRAAEWGLLGHHLSKWGNLAILYRAREVLLFRIPLLVEAFAGYFLLLLVILLSGRRQAVTPIVRTPAIIVVIAALCLFAIPNLVSGAFYLDYFIPVVFTLFPILGILWMDAFSHVGHYGKIGLQVVLPSAAILGLLLGGPLFIDYSGKQLPIVEIDKLSQIVGCYSSSDDRIFALEGLWIVVEANRRTPPNMTMSYFSYLDSDIETANRLHLINAQIVQEYFDRGLMAVVILTDQDWDLLRSAANHRQIADALGKNYRLIVRESNFGQQKGGVEIWIRRTGISK